MGVGNRLGAVRCHYRVVERARAPRERVFSLLTEAPRWAEWSGVPRASLERSGTPLPNGVGSVRRLGFPPFAGSREEVVLYEPPSRTAYVILSGTLPVKEYRAEVNFETAGPGETIIIWEGTFSPAVPGTARLMEAIVHRTISRFARRLARHAEGVA